jgi:iron(III) transport system ATP-binding protein
MLERIGLGAFADAYPHMLSGGEQQRVALARALAPGPKLMLMDEPFSGPDVRLRDHVREATLSLLAEAGTGTLMVTHDPEEAMRVGDRIAVMQEGRLIQIGSAEDLYDRPVSPFVARFFGETNAFAGRAAAGGVPTPWGMVALPPGIAPDAPVEVLVRPEGIVVDAKTSGISAACPGCPPHGSPNCRGTGRLRPARRSRSASMRLTHSCFRPRQFICAPDAFSTYCVHL